ncbi:uncharacterized protein F4812DRAFT_372683 [Daldinia caldariorum]|uniref:uncharacterized protein n=1 Tax=Daldinia caldariorum TaxID=326644 RepID=UPI0020080E71|nr:uncharacterized protein F4812DRAFT_372683 [Daldinia caldariorum]KAI1468542.1 hypothetical protein F4812DRAFT_372683 [Daldinia caldariorum]
MAIGLEIPVFGASAAAKAIESGATRIELNAAGSYPDGGLTPPLKDLEIVAHSSVPLRVMIRPRAPPSQAQARDFIYSDEEFEEMEASIQRFKATGLLDEERGDGFVFGILEESQDATEVGTHRRKCWIDKERCDRLVAGARPFKTVFHRAFDEVASCDDSGSMTVDDCYAWKTALDDLAACGFDGILTSGGLGNAVQNLAILDELITRAEALGIEIIIGGGVRKHNIQLLCQQLKLRERNSSTYVHSACLSSTDSESVDAGEVIGILSHLG